MSPPTANRQPIRRLESHRNAMSPVIRADMTLSSGRARADRRTSLHPMGQHGRWQARPASVPRDARAAAQPAQGPASAAAAQPAAEARAWRDKLQLYNTLARQKQAFTCRPESPNRVQMYVCGVTVYDFSHIGGCTCPWCRPAPPSLVVRLQRTCWLRAVLCPKGCARLASCRQAPTQAGSTTSRACPV